MEVESGNIAILNGNVKLTLAGRALPNHAAVAAARRLVRRSHELECDRGFFVAEDRHTDRDRLEYLTAMLAELRRMSGGDEHPMLSYLIEMAWLEARGILDDDGASGRTRDKRNAVA